MPNSVLRFARAVARKSCQPICEHRGWIVGGLLWVGATGWAVLHEDSDWFRLASGFWLVSLPAWLAWLALPARAAVMALSRLRQRRWRVAALLLVLPGLTAVAFLIPESVSTQYVFWTLRPTYERMMRQARRANCTPPGDVPIDGIDCEDPTIAVFPWFGFGPITQGVVFDGTDEIALEPNQRSRHWRDRRTGAELQCAFALEQLGHHYYRFIEYGLDLHDGICG